MKVVAITSRVGGSGRTTLTAALACALVRRGHAALALDLDPADLLALHLGATDPQDSGLHAALLDTTQTLPLRAVQNSDGVRVLSFGLPEHPSATAVLRDHPRRLRDLLQRLGLADDAVVLIDTPRLPSIYADQALAAADLQLHLWRADVASFAQLPALPGSTRQALHLINLMDPTRRLQSDLHALLRARLGTALLPPIHRDEALCEAFAANRNPFEYAPRSRAMTDLEALAERLLLSLSGTGAAAQADA